MNLRDHVWVWQLILETQLCKRSYCVQKPGQLVPWQLLEDVRAIIKRAEESVMYVKNWCEVHELGICFDKLEERRRQTLPQSHPCNLIRPYVAISNA